MNETTRLSPQQRDDLVAYLDGELDEETTQSMERTLAHSPVARHEMDMLTRTWSLLDELPQPSPSAEFTQRTVTAVRLENVSTRLSDRVWFQNARRGCIVVGWLFVLAIGSMLGFQVAREITPVKNADLIRDVQVIENHEPYRDVGDVPFLRELERAKVFDEVPDANNP